MESLTAPFAESRHDSEPNRLSFSQRLASSLRKP
jgi:hypothetical protein